MGKHILLLLFLFGFSASLTWATPACVDGTTLASYVALGATGCQIGDKIFSDFSYAPTSINTAPVPATSVVVDTVGPSGETISGSRIGLQFNAPWTAGTGAANDGAITFLVTVASGGPILIEDAALAQVSAISGTGAASVGESGCGPTPCTVGQWTLMTFNATTGSQASDHTIFTPTGSIEVTKDISATGGSNGSASLSVVQDTFSQTAVPEPTTITLIGFSLAIIGGLRLRRRRAAE
jgi:PEP-CTERM motif